MKTLLVLCVLFLACSSPNEPQAYLMPEQTDDGWKVSSLQAENIDAKKIKEMDELIMSDDMYSGIHSFTIVRNGKLVFDKYYPAYPKNSYGDKDPSTPHTIQSITKAFTSALIGIAIDKKLIVSVDEKLKIFFPEYPSVDWSNGKDKISIKHALQMKSGIRWNEEYHNANSDISRFGASGDYYRYLLTRPMDSEPGEVFKYNTGLSVILGGVLLKASNMTAIEFAKTYLFNPLGINHFKWIENASGQIHTGGGLVLSPRDLAKFGQLYLNDGSWNGKQVISKEWAIESRFVDQTYPVEENIKKKYAYHWNVSDFVVGNKTIRTYEHGGYGGQGLFYIPAFNTVVAFTAWYDDYEGMQRSFKLFHKYILPSLK